MKFTALTLLAISLMCSAIIAAALLWLDRADLRPYVHEMLVRASAASGRQIAVTGRLDVKVGLHPQLRMEGLTIANAPWGRSEHALQVESVEIQVSFLDFLRGDFAVDSLRVNGVRASFEVNAAGESNWQVHDPRSLKKALSPLLVLVRGANLLSAVDAELNHMVVDYHDHARAEPTSLEVETAALMRASSADPLTASLDGRLQGRPIGLSARMSAPSLRKEYEVFVRFSGEQAVIVADGNLIDRGEKADIELALHGAISGLGRVNELLNTRLPPLEPVLFGAHLSGDGREMRFEGINASFGSAHLHGAVAYFQGNERPHFQVDLTASNVDTHSWFPRAIGANEADARTGKIVWLDAPISLSLLQFADIEGRLALADAVIEQFTLQSADAQFELRNGTLRVSSLAMKAPAGSVGMSATVAEVDGAPKLDAKLEGMIQPVRLRNPKAKTGPNVAGAIAVEASGGTLRQALDQASVSADVELKGNGLPEALKVALRPLGTQPEPLELTHVVDVRIRRAGKEYTLNSQVAAPSRLISSDAPFPLRVNTQYDQVRLSADGALRDIFAGFKFAFDINANAAAAKGASDSNIFPLEATARVVGSFKEQRAKASNIRVRSPYGRGSASLSLSWASQRPRLTGEVHLDEMSPPTVPASRGPQSVASQPRRNVDWLESALELNWLQLLDSELGLKAVNVPLGPLFVTRADGLLTLRQGRLAVEFDEIATSGGNIATRFELASLADAVQVQANLQSKSFDLSTLRADDASLRGSQPRLAGTVTWVGQGRSVNELLDNISAQLRLAWQKGGEEQVATSSLRLAQEDKDGRALLTVRGDALVKGQDLSVDLETGELGQLLAAQRPVPLRLVLDMGSIHATATGSTTGLLSDPRAELNLAVEASSLSPLRFALNDGVEHLSPLTANARLAVSSSTLEVADLLIQAGKGKVDGSLNVQADGKRARVDGSLQLVDLDLSWEVPAEKSNVDAVRREEPDRSRLFSAEPLDFGWLHRTDADLKLAATNLFLPGRVVDGFLADLQIDDGILTADVRRPPTSDDRDAYAKIRLDTRSEPANLDVSTRTRGIDLRTLLSRSELAGLVTGDLVTDMELHSRGASVADMMAALNGKVRVVLTNGQAKTKALDRLVGGARAVMGQMLSPKRESTKVNCAICDLVIESGVVSSRLTLLDTEYSTVFAEGMLDLADEQVKLKFTPQAKGITLSVASPVNIAGPLSHPSVSLDAKGTIDTVVNLVAAVAYPPVLLIGLEDMVGSQDNPCITMVKPKEKGPIRRLLKKLGPGAKEGTEGQIDDATEPQ